MNWGVLLNVLMNVPKVVTGVEVLVQGAKLGATKKQLALAALGFAVDTATTVAPQYSAQEQAAANLVGYAIDNWAAILFPPKPVVQPLPTGIGGANAVPVVNVVGN